MAWPVFVSSMQKIPIISYIESERPLPTVKIWIEFYNYY
jgi:hypothetical protein